VFFFLFSTSDTKHPQMSGQKRSRDTIQGNSDGVSGISAPNKRSRGQNGGAITVRARKVAAQVIPNIPGPGQFQRGIKRKQLENDLINEARRKIVATNENEGSTIDNGYEPYDTLGNMSLRKVHNKLFGGLHTADRKFLQFNVTGANPQNFTLVTSTFPCVLTAFDVNINWKSVAGSDNNFGVLRVIRQGQIGTVLTPANNNVPISTPESDIVCASISCEQGASSSTGNGFVRKTSKSWKLDIGDFLQLATAGDSGDTQFVGTIEFYIMS